MQLHTKPPAKQQGAFMVIAMILLVVLSLIGVAAMTMATTSQRVGNNYTKYLAAEIKALSMAGYATRILATFPNGVYFGPGSCNSSSSCNNIINTFPMNGRPILPWVAGAGTNEVIGSSKSNSWWETNGFAYEGVFAGNGTADVLITNLGSDPSAPYTNTYRITGYGTDPISGIVKATFQSYHVWTAYPADPGDGTCAGGCLYGQCCGSDNTCGTTKTACEGASAAYVPPGWSCVDYFVNGLGFDASACINPIAPPT